MSITSKNPVSVWDFTYAKSNGKTHTDIIPILREHCKKYCFQLEQGSENGYLHYQGRVSLKVRTRDPRKSIPEMNLGIWRPTSNENSDNQFYVMKQETKVEGEWKDTDPDTYIPKQYSINSLYPWQQYVIDSINVFEPRKINVIVDPRGNNGKSTLSAIAELKYGAIDCPTVNDGKELIQAVYCILSSTNNRQPKGLFFDMPRAQSKEHLNGLYSAIEQIKKGKVYDFRYSYKQWWFDSPQVWVFTNEEVDCNLLSKDRWNIWRICVDNKLILQTPVFNGGKPVIQYIKKPAQSAQLCLSPLSQTDDDVLIVELYDTD